MSQIAQYRGTGKRKTSVARVILRPGDGTTWVNGRTIEEYFPRAVWQTIAVSPLKTAGLEGQVDARGQGDVTWRACRRIRTGDDEQLRLLLGSDAEQIVRSAPVTGRRRGH